MSTASAETISLSGGETDSNAHSLADDGAAPAVASVGNSPNTLSGTLTLTGNSTFYTTADLTVASELERNDTNTLTKTGGAQLTLSNRKLIKSVNVQEGTLNVNGDSTFGGFLLGCQLTVDGQNAVLTGSNLFGISNDSSGGGYSNGDLYLKNGGVLNYSNGNNDAVIAYNVFMDNGKITGGDLKLDVPVKVNSGTSNVINANSVTIRYEEQSSGDKYTYRGGIFDVDNDAVLTIESNISGDNVSLVKSGQGELVLSGANTYSGGTTVSEGVLKVANSLSLGAGDVTLSGGTLKLPSFSPNETLPVTEGLVARFDAAAENSIVTDANGNVTTWKDSSGNENNATAATGTNNQGVIQPIKVSDSGLNGMTTLDFDNGGNSYLNFNKISDIKSVFWVMKDDAPATNDHGAFLLGEDSNNGGTDFHRGNNGNIWSFDNRGWCKADNNSTTTIDGKVVYIGGDDNNGTTTGNTVLGKYWQTASVVTSDNLAASSIAADRNNQYGPRSWTGEMAEILIYNTQLTDEQVLSVNSYLMNKWGLFNSPTTINVTEDSVIDTVDKASIAFGKIDIASGKMLTVQMEDYAKLYSPVTGSGKLTINNGVVSTINDGTYTGLDITELWGNGDLELRLAGHPNDANSYLRNLTSNYINGDVEQGKKFSGVISLVKEGNTTAYTKIDTNLNESGFEGYTFVVNPDTTIYVNGKELKADVLISGMGDVERMGALRVNNTVRGNIGVLTDNAWICIDSGTKNVYGNIFSVSEQEGEITVQITSRINNSTGNFSGEISNGTSGSILGVEIFTNNNNRGVGLTVTMSGDLSYTGATTIDAGTTLNLSGSANLVNSREAIVNGTLNFSNYSGTEDMQFNNLTGTDGKITGTGKNLILHNNQTTQYIGSITAQTIEKTGNGTLQLYAKDSNSPVQAAGGFAINSGRLDFKGYFSGALTVNNGAIMSPGNSIGTLNETGDFTLNSGAKLLMEIGGLTAELNDQLIVNGNSVFENGSIIEFVLDSDSSYAPSLGDVIPVTMPEVDWNNATFSSYYFTLGEYSNGIQYLGVNPNAVPEPSTWALLILGAAGLLYVRKRNNERR